MSNADNQGAAQDAQDAANSAVDALQNLANKAVDLPVEVAGDVFRTAIRTLERLGDAVFGSENQ